MLASRPIARSAWRANIWPVGALIVWVALVAALYAGANSGLFATNAADQPAGVTTCLFRRITGQPCPTCGSTRAAAALLHADVPAAFRLNPLTTTLMLAAPLLIAAWMIARRRAVDTAAWMGRRWRTILLVGAAIIAANWVYLFFQPESRGPQGPRVNEPAHHRVHQPPADHSSNQPLSPSARSNRTAPPVESFPPGTVTPFTTPPGTCRSPACESSIWSSLTLGRID